jgi:hypothetical protein
MDKYNPIIHAFSENPAKFEDFLLRNYTRSLRSRCAEALDPNALALLFFNEMNEENTAKSARILAEIEFA